MKMIASDLLRVAREVLLRETLIFEDTAKTEDRSRNSVHFELQRFVDRVRRNEKLDTFLNREDDDNEMRLEVGLSDHEAIEAIVEEIEATAKKLSKRNDLLMKRL